MHACLLTCFHFGKPFKLAFDANDVGCGAVLLQEDNSEIDYLVSYYLYKFNIPQKNYSTSEKEVLALMIALQHFPVYLGTPAAEVLVYTDHNPLVFYQLYERYESEIVEVESCVTRVQSENYSYPGKDNVIADVVSRVA